ncbi:MAG: molybdopterin molybdenumtransferase MoeA [Anaerolineales bacterium]|nr:molybdopterin molybdenumtransferase MoeA [Anaerolineales bacterium]
MPEFLQLLPPGEALEIFLRGLTHQVGAELVDTAEALGRVTAQAVQAPHNLPTFSRSTVDGYAVRAQDTYGASESLPVYLPVVGEVLMGATPQFKLAAAQCALIHTGGMLPEGANAVVMLEQTQSTRPGEIEVLRDMAVGENIIKVGEDVRQGEEVFKAGLRLRPSEIGGLMALGLTRLLAARRPRVGILSSGDEVVPPDQDISLGQVRDVNSYSLSALVEASGGIPVRYGILPDHESALREAAVRALEQCDMVLITAGSSASARDLTSQVIEALGRPGVLVHGVNIRPGKPTILAVCEGKPVIGLPGNPVSALVIARLFVTPAIEWLLGVRQPRPQAVVTARLSLNIPSQSGREDWTPVRLLGNPGSYTAEPVFGKSNMIFILARADGLVKIPAAATGLTSGDLVEVYLL